MKIPSVLAACGLAFACATGVARAEVDAAAKRPSSARVSEGQPIERPAHATGAATDEAAGWLTPAKACLVLAVIGALALMGRRRGFD